MARVAETEHALLGAALFLVAAGTADGGVITAGVERLAQRLGLHHIGVHAGAVADRADALRLPQRIDVHLQIDAVARRYRIAEWVHLARSEEHTSELQSLMRISYAVFCLKKKKKR